MTTTPIPPPPPAGYAYAKPGQTMAVAAIVLGAIGAVIGLGPFIFGVFAAAFGLAAVILGVIAYRAARKVNAKRGRVGVLLGALALGLGIYGMATVDQAIDDLERDLEQIDDGPIDRDSYTPPSAVEIREASDDELWELWFDAPGGSDAEARIEAELERRGEF